VTDEYGTFTQDVDVELIYTGFDDEESFAQFLSELCEFNAWFSTEIEDGDTVIIKPAGNISSILDMEITAAASTFDNSKLTGFKLGSIHPIGIVYYDKYGRNGGVCATPAMDAYMTSYRGTSGTVGTGGVSYITDTSAAWEMNQFRGFNITIAGETRVVSANLSNQLFVSTPFSTDPSGKAYVIQGQGLEYRGVINWSIYNQPPVWAYKWGFVYAGSSNVLSWVQYPIDGITDGTVELAEYSLVDISSLNTHKTGGADYVYPSSSVNPITQTDIDNGLRIRFITEASATSGTDDCILGQTLMTDFDFQVIGYQDDDPTTNILLVKKFGHVAASIGAGSAVELYIPRKDISEKVYYETGKVYDVGNPGISTRYHYGEFQNQDGSDPSTTPATGKLVNGNAYYYPRSFASNLITTDSPGRIAIVESMNMSDLYESDSYNKGKAFTILENPGTKKYPFFRWSDRYYPGTNVNGLSKFDSANRTKQLEDEFGDIVSVQLAGTVLRVFQKRKTSSIYIGRTVLLSDGTDQESISTSSKVLATIRPHAEDCGTVFPNSVYSSGNWSYFFDIYSGKFFRMATNGVQEISAYGMKNYFRDKSQALLSSGIENVDVISVFDSKHNSLIVSFRDYSDSSNDETIVFYEPSNKWYTFWEIYPEMYGVIGDYLVSFRTGNLYEHDSNTRMMLHGTQRSFELQFVSNINPDKVKCLDAISLDTSNNKYNSLYPTKSWQVYSVTVPASSQYPNGQYSKIPASRFVHKQGRLYSDFLRDAYTTTGSETPLDYINGQKLMNNFFLITLKHTNTDLVNLKMVDILSTDVELS